MALLFFNCLVYISVFIYFEYDCSVIKHSLVSAALHNFSPFFLSPFVSLSHCACDRHTHTHISAQLSTHPIRVIFRWKLKIILSQSNTSNCASVSVSACTAYHLTTILRFAAPHTEHLKEERKK